ncbi:MAG TPA: hypothetical protein VGW33_15695 [Terriglobia bacterium]|nr:hypothetical protein [Terriglobia bacterium]
MRFRYARQRFVAVSLIAVFNAAWFYAAGCGTLCAFRSCPQVNAAHAQQCHHHSGRPRPASNSGRGASCVQHVLVATAASASTWQLVRIANRSAAASSVNLTAAMPKGLLTLPGNLSHSPPTPSAGRSACLKTSVLRV